MKYPILLTACVLAISSCHFEYSEKEKQHSTQRENVIKDYFSGWENKNWAQIEKNLDPAFTFTSPNNDDHLPIQKFKDKCWEQAAHIQNFKFIRFAPTETGSYVTYQLFTRDSTNFRNTEYFDFNGEKIKSIEVFFGVGEGGQGFPTNKK